jgi:hypothetical protein
MDPQCGAPVVHDPGEVCICGVITTSSTILGKWPGEPPIDLPYHFDYSGYRGNLTAADLDAVFAQAWAYWAEHVEITPRRIASRSGAKVWGTFARIDGPSNTLAWSMLANDSNSPKEQRYDAGDTWVKMNPERPSGGIDLVRVACHEIGHVLGLPHDSGNANALLRPSYSVDIPKPTARDVDRLVGLGYKRRTTPLPPPPPPDDPPPVSGLRLPLPGGGHLEADYPTRTVTYPPGWTGSVKTASEEQP